MSEQAEHNNSKLRSVFARVFGIAVENLPATIDTDTIESWDSLAHLSLIEQLERDFDIQLSQAEAVTMLSESDIVRVLAEKARKQLWSPALMTSTSTNRSKSEVLSLPGEAMYEWLKDLFPICRSLTGNGVRATLLFIQGLVPGLQVREVPSGTAAFDWTIPDEWNISDAYIENEQGQRLVDFAKSNLHVMGYSEPVDTWMDRQELDAYLHSLPEHPDWIPYVTSYYERQWGFCLSQRQRDALPPGRYHVVVRSTLAPGSLSYGEILLPGHVKDEVLLSTYVCHPSMANNELSGPVVTAALARWIASLEDRRLTYRIVFIPETIGSVVYLSKHIKELKQNVRAGYVVTCVGDDRTFSFVPSRLGNTLADRVARHVLRHRAPDHVAYTFLDRGSDERQFCAPGVDLPVASIMRSKYGVYPEYHTSADDLSLVTPAGLKGAFDIYRECLSILENNDYYRTTVLCEPQLGKRGLYPTVSTKRSGAQVRHMMNIIAYCDGYHDLIEVADRVGLPASSVTEILRPLIQHGLVERQGGDSR